MRKTRTTLITVIAIGLLAGLTVGVTAQEEPVEVTAHADAHGRFELPPLPPGPIGVEVLAADAETPSTCPIVALHNPAVQLSAKTTFACWPDTNGRLFRS